MSVRPPGFGSRPLPRIDPARKPGAVRQLTPLGQFQESARRLAKIMRRETQHRRGLLPVKGPEALIVQVDLRAALDEIDALPAGAPVVQGSLPPPQLSRIAGFLQRASEQVESGRATVMSLDGQVARYIADELRETVNAAHQAELFPRRQS